MMATVREPVLRPVPIAELRPTHITVGMREVVEKRKRWRMEGKKKAAEFLGKHMVPVILGPKERHYVIDHHHLARALHDEGIKDILVTVIGDLRMVEKDAFWGVMDNKGWVYPYDAKGERRHFDDLPKRIKDLKDDPFRSLAGECGAPAVSPRTRRRSANSCGQTFSGARSRARLSKTTSPRRSKRRSNSQKTMTRSISQAGADRTRTRRRALSTPVNERASTAKRG